MRSPAFAKQGVSFLGLKKSIGELPEGDVLIRVKNAALNYKDALSSSGHKGITRNFPHTPGVDACGIVEASESTDFKVGDAVIVTSYDFGMNTSGGFQEYIRVPATWPVKLPDHMTLEESMVLGTGGFTAALSLYKMEQNGQEGSIVTLLCDSGDRYLETYYNPDWVAECIGDYRDFADKLRADFG